MAALAMQLASLSLNPVQVLNSAKLRSCTTKTVLPSIECAKHPQKKCTAHHNKSRPKKHNPYDKNRKGPTVYPPREKPPPIWGFDTGDVLVEVAVEPAIA